MHVVGKKLRILLDLRVEHLAIGLRAVDLRDPARTFAVRTGRHFLREFRRTSYRVVTPSELALKGLAKSSSRIVI